MKNKPIALKTGYTVLDVCRRTEMKKSTCISGPMGCQPCVVLKNGGFKINGNSCGPGIKYVKKEITDPYKNISSAVKLKNGFLNLRPVKTTAPIPKDRIAALTQKINGLTALVNTGGIIIKNVLNTGAARATLHSAARADGLCSSTP